MATGCSDSRTAADNDYLLGPTHEELFTLTVKGEYNSYKDFPLLLFQIQTKYRDEARPAGRHPPWARVHHEGLLLLRRQLTRVCGTVYLAHREAYQKMFSRMAIRYVIVSAVSGAMGGSASEEFLAESDIGEDTFVRCLESGYAANVEAVTTAMPDPVPVEDLPRSARA